MFAAQTACEPELTMSIEYLVIGLIAVGLLMYLLWALLRPERL